MGKRTRGQQIFAVFNALLMVLIIITCLLPLINVLAVSFSRQEAVAAGEVSLLPVGFTTVAYTTILKDRLFLRTFGNSLLRLLAGELPHGGAITGAVGTYFPQRVRQPEQLTVTKRLFWMSNSLAKLPPVAWNWSLSK